MNHPRTGSNAAQSGRIVTLTALVLFVLLSACEEKVKPPIAAAGPVNERPTQESWNSRIIFSDSGIVRAVLNSTHLAMFDQKKITVLDSGLVVDFYDTDKSHSSKLTADRGLVHDDTKNLEAFGHVVFVSDSGVVVHTEYLLWNNTTRKISSDKFVTVTKPKEQLQGYGFEADQGLKNYTIFRVSGQAEYKK